ncbi:6441_t:CDS:2, partial [Acaulospora colombiana]
TIAKVVDDNLRRGEKRTLLVGKDNNKSTAVTNTAHANRGIRCNNTPGARMFNTVVMKFIAPSMDEIPAR